MRERFKAAWEWARQRLGLSRSNDDLDEELRLHAEMQAQEWTDQGMAPAEALRRAHAMTGSRRSLIETMRDQDLWARLADAKKEIAFAFRSLVKRPAFSVTAILTLALGIGANTTIFTMLHGLFWQRLPVPHPERLVEISFTFQVEGRTEHVGVAKVVLEELIRTSSTLQSFGSWEGIAVQIRDRDGTLRQRIAAPVRGDTLANLGLQPALGRLITAADDVAGGTPVAVLSDSYWADRYLRDPDVIGREINLSGIAYTVIGVLPANFLGPRLGERTDLYVSAQSMPALLQIMHVNYIPRENFVRALARLRDGVTLKQADAEMQGRTEALLPLLSARHRALPGLRGTRLRVTAAPTGLRPVAQAVRQPLLLMQGLVAVVLLLCCVNVSGLLTAKMYERAHEFAVRTALGAPRYRLIRQFFLESLLLACGGGLLGAMLAWSITDWCLSFFMDPVAQEGLALSPDVTTFFATGALALISTLLFGTLPAIRISRADPGVLLKTRTASGLRRQLAGRAFIPAQVSISMVLVAVALLLSQSLVRLRTEHSGFNVQNITLTTPQLMTIGDKARRIQIYRGLVEQVKAAPGVTAAAITFVTPMTGFTPFARFHAVADGHRAEEPQRLAYNLVGPGYFDTMQTRIIEGREFTNSDRNADLCVLSESAAHLLFPQGAAIGQYVRNPQEAEHIPATTCRVIGIAQDAKYGSLREQPQHTVYFPIVESLVDRSNMVVLMRASSEQQAIQAYKAALARVAPSTPLLRFATLRQQMNDSLGSERLITLLCSFFAGLALVLSALGLYGLLAANVAQRTAEIGIRVALGAQRSAIMQLFLTQASRLVGIGMAGGAVLLAFAVRAVHRLLYGISAADGTTLLLTLGALMAVTAVATLIPARRAASIAPMEALRAE